MDLQYGERKAGTDTARDIDPNNRQGLSLNRSGERTDEGDTLRIGSRVSGLFQTGICGKRKEEQTNKLVMIAKTLLNELITWKEMHDEETSKEQAILELRRRLARSEEALRFTGMAYNIAMVECDQLRSAQVEKERAIERLTAELDVEKKARREVERSRADAQADIKSLHRQLDIANEDAADAESRLGMAMDMLHKPTKEKDEWKRTQLQMTVDMEKLSHDNRRLRAAKGQCDAKIQALRATKEKVKHAMAALQMELATIKMECKVAISAVNKYKGSLADADMKNRRLLWQLEKGQSLAHANVKRLL
jgi:chromosome segregation ATPase